jgi:hypothetical protein
MSGWLLIAINEINIFLKPIFFLSSLADYTQDLNHLNISDENKDFLEKCFKIIIETF